MTARAVGTFKSEEWDEQTYQELAGGGKLTRAVMRFAFSGDIEGESRSAMLMAYPADGVVHFVGLDLVTGRIGDLSGSFVLQETGTFAPGQLKATWIVVPGSGTGELRGLSGSGGYAHAEDDGDDVAYALDFDIA